MLPSQTASLASVQEAADHFGVSTKSIRRWISSGLIKGYRVGPRLIRVDLDSLDALTRPLQYMGGDAE